MTVDDQAQSRRRAILAEYAEEESDAAEQETAAALDVPLNLRITKGLDAQLRQRAAADQIPTSALVRRLLSRALEDSTAAALTEQQVEAIARRVVQESR